MTRCRGFRSASAQLPASHTPLRFGGRYGALFYRLLAGHLPVDTALVHAAVDLLKAKAPMRGSRRSSSYGQRWPALICAALTAGIGTKSDDAHPRGSRVAPHDEPDAGLRQTGQCVDPAVIAGVRKKLELDQREAGEIFGGGVDAFSRYEIGKTKPPIALVKLLEVLDRHPDWLDEVRAA